MTHSGIFISMERRRAEVQLSACWKKQLGIAEGLVQCYASGLFLVQDGDYASAAFVCELDDGRIFAAVVDQIRFMSTAGEINHSLRR